jgi:hypothetical protein
LMGSLVSGELMVSGLSLSPSPAPRIMAYVTG